MERAGLLVALDSIAASLAAADDRPTTTSIPIHAAVLSGSSTEDNRLIPRYRLSHSFDMTSGPVIVIYKMTNANGVSAGASVLTEATNDRTTNIVYGVKRIDPAAASDATLVGDEAAQNLLATLAPALLRMQTHGEDPISAVEAVYASGQS